VPVTLYFRSKENPDDLNAFVPPPQSVGHNMVRHILFWAIPGPPGEARIKSLSLILRRLDEIDDLGWGSLCAGFPPTYRSSIAGVTWLKITTPIRRIRCR